MPTLKSIAVYCGSKTGNNPAHRAATIHLARALAAANITLVYGGGKVGLMGVIADAMLAHNGQVVGVMPQHLIDRELAHPKIQEMHIVNSMHERKALINNLADGIILLPGGTGSLEEFFEAWTWGMLGLHQKPCGILNVDGYFNDLLKFMDHATQHEFLGTQHREMIIVKENPEQLLNALSQYQPLTEIKWSKKT